MFTYIKEHGIFGYDWKHALTHPWIVVECAYNEVKYFIQRGRRGYSDRDAWAIDDYIARWIPKVIRGLKDGYGVPSSVICEMFPSSAKKMEGFSDEECKIARARWNDVLEKIAIGFEAHNAIADMTWTSNEQLEKFQDDAKHGLHLFAKHFGAFWD